MSRFFQLARKILCPIALIALPPSQGSAETIRFHKTDTTFARQITYSGFAMPAKPSLIEYHKNSEAYLPIWDPRTLKLATPWDLGDLLVSSPKAISLLGTSGDVYWKGHLRPEPAAPVAARLATVSLPATAFFMSLSVFALWLAGTSRKTQPLKRRYN